MAAPEIPPEVAADADGGLVDAHRGWSAEAVLVRLDRDDRQPAGPVRRAVPRALSRPGARRLAHHHRSGPRRASASARSHRQPLGGWLADRYGRRFTLVLGLTSSAAALALLGVARPLWLIAVAAVLYGLVVDMYRPAVGAAVADLVDPKDRVRAYALVYWAVNLGVSFSGLLGGVLALHGWWLLFTLDAHHLRGLGRAHRAWRPRDPAGAGPSRRWRLLRGGLNDRLLLALVALTVVGADRLLQAYITLPLSMREDGLSPAAYGVAYAVNPIVVICRPAVHAAPADDRCPGCGSTHVARRCSASASA